MPNSAADKLKQRQKKLRELQERLRNGQHVQNRDLRRWLGDELFDEMEYEWQQQKEMRQVAKPDRIAKYEQRLKQGIFEHNKSENYSRKGLRAAAKAAMHRSQTAFEKALEHLEESLAADPSINAWLDRPVDFTPGYGPSPDPVGMPRVVTSRSLDNLASGKPLAARSKSQVKLDAIERALSDDGRRNSPALDETTTLDNFRSMRERLKL